jgi:hypothetical protein
MLTCEDEVEKTICEISFDKDALLYLRPPAFCRPPSPSIPGATNKRETERPNTDRTKKKKKKKVSGMLRDAEKTESAK